MTDCRIYFLSVKEMSDTEFIKIYSLLSDNRRRRVDSLKSKSDKKLSAGVEILLNYALMTNSFCEKGMMDKIIRRKNGKPCFSFSGAPHFSLSHSGDYAMCALSETEIGCDIEEIKASDKYDNAVAKRFFTNQEAEHISLLKSHHAQFCEFYRIWTKKESFLKLTGEGFARSLSSFSVPLQQISTIIDRKTYYFEDIPSPDGYISSAASESPFKPTVSICELTEIMKAIQ